MRPLSSHPYKAGTDYTGGELGPTGMYDVLTLRVGALRKRANAYSISVVSIGDADPQLKQCRTDDKHLQVGWVMKSAYLINPCTLM